MWETTVNELVNGKFTVPAGGPIRAGDREDGERRRAGVFSLSDGEEGGAWKKGDGKEEDACN